MKSNFKKLPGSIIDLEVVLDQKEFKNYWDDAYNQALSDISLKGFRPGSAPKELADQVVDKEKVFHQAATDAVRYGLDEISKENHWTIIDKPEISVDEYKLGLKYKAKLTIFPEIQLGNYKKIAKKIFSEKKEIKIEPQEIDKTLEWLRQSRKKGLPGQGDQVPELNDEFAKSLGQDFKNVEDLKKSVLTGLTMEKEYREKDRKRLRVLEEIIKDSKIEVPDIMIEKTLDQMTGGKKELREGLRDKARQNVLSNLVLYKIAAEEKIQPDLEQAVDSLKVFQRLESLATK